MRIVENSVQRVVISKDRRWWVTLLWYSVSLAAITGIAVWYLFCDLANFAAPGWAEAHGLSGLGLMAGSDSLLGRGQSLLAYMFGVGFSMLVIVVLILNFGFIGWRRLDFDFGAGIVTLTRRGIFRMPTRQFRLSNIILKVVRSKDDKGDETARLSVVVRSPSHPSDEEIWSTFWSPMSITRDQERELERLFRALPEREGLNPIPFGTPQPSS